jgi:hypothetical protein
MLSHTLHTAQLFNEYLGTSNTHSSSLDLVGFFDVDFAGCEIDQKSTSVTCHFLGSSLIYWSS